MATFKVTILEDDESLAVTPAGSQSNTRLVVSQNEPLILTQNAAVATGCFMNSQGVIYKTTKAKPIAAWDDAEFVYIQVRNGHVHKFSLNTGRKT